MTDPIKLNMPFVGIPSFCRFPICFDLDTLDADVAILGIPYDDGASYRPGVRFAPRRIREMSLRHSARGSRPTGYYEFELSKYSLITKFEMIASEIVVMLMSYIRSR